MAVCGDWGDVWGCVGTGVMCGGVWGCVGTGVMCGGVVI